jgi:kynurenine formamidase
MPSAAVDYYGIMYHGMQTTHIDALCHVFHEGKMFNGHPASDVTTTGARSGAVDAFRLGVTTRGVLVDIPRFRGVDHVAIGAPVRGWELEAAAERQGTPLQPGDAVLIRSNRTGFEAANPSWVPGRPPSPGVHADCAPVLKRHDVALLGWDQLDATPSGYPAFDAPGPHLSLPVHVFAIVMMGMPLLDNADLEDLAAACAEEQRWEFLLTLNPLCIRGGTGSPVNPIATF